jgi:hypothetical protein
VRQRDTLLINARLLLDFEQAGKHAYQSIGIREYQREPYYKWLPEHLRCDLEEATEYQVARDARFATRLFDTTVRGVRELPPLDIAHLFVEAGARVVVVSHETQDALAAVVARCGLPESVLKIGMVSLDQLDEVIDEVAADSSWLVVYETGLTPGYEKRIVTGLNGRGVFINVENPIRTREADEQLLKAIEQRWA